MEELLYEGYGEAVIDLAEHALVRVEEALGSIDDSDGNMGVILVRLQEIHLKACEPARPFKQALRLRLGRRRLLQRAPR